MDITGQPQCTSKCFDGPQVKRRLRGRLPWVAALCVVGAAAGAFLGYRALEPAYRSEARLRVIPLIAAADDGARFDAFVNEQVQRIAHRGVLEPAMVRCAKHASGSESGDYDAFARRVSVRREGDAGILTIGFEDSDPRVAADAASAVAASYLEQTPRVDATVAQQQYASLDNEARRLEESLAAVRLKVSQTGNSAQIQAVRQRHEYLLGRLNNIERDLEQMRTVFIENEPKVADKTVVTVSADPKREEMVSQKQQIEAELDQLTGRFGKEHRVVQQRLVELATVNQWLRQHPATAAAPAVEVAARKATTASPQDIAAMRQRQAALCALKQSVETDIAQLLDKSAELIKLQQVNEAMEHYAGEAELARKRFAEAAAVGGQVQIERQAGVPLTPCRDGRLGTAALGALLGIALGLGGALMLGPAPRPVRSATDLSRSIPLLGALPTMSDPLAEPETATAAALCVHNLRNMVQLGVAGADARTFALTSTGPGSGKTSVSLALGLSFAASGSRTLLIDADFAGRSLSQRAERMGLELTGASDVGLMAALGGQPVTQCAATTSVPRLSILGLNNAAGADAHYLCASSLRRVLDDARESYDAVLIDAPAATGRVETPVIASEADAVLLVVTRGEDQRQVEQTINALTRIGARVAGLIFNHAPAQDVEQLTAQREAA